MEQSNDSIFPQISREMTVANGGKLIKMLVTTVMGFTFVAAMTMFSTNQNAKTVEVLAEQVGMLLVEVATTKTQTQTYQEAAQLKNQSQDSRIQINSARIDSLQGRTQ